MWGPGAGAARSWVAAQQGLRELHLQHSEIAQRLHPTFAPGSCSPQRPSRSTLALSPRSVALLRGLETPLPPCRLGWKASLLRFALGAGGRRRLHGAARVWARSRAATDPDCKSHDGDTGGFAAGDAALARPLQSAGPGPGAIPDALGSPAAYLGARSRQVCVACPDLRASSLARHPCCLLRRTHQI